MKKSAKRFSFILTATLLLTLLLPFPYLHAANEPLMHDEEQWELSKQVLGHTYFGNEEVTYELTFNHLSVHDDCTRLNLEEVLFTDYLPPSATFVRATLGGKYDPETHTVTWINPEDLIDNPTLFGSDNPYSFAVVVKYPQATNVTKVIHRTTAEYTSLGEESPIKVETQLIHGFTKKFDK